MNELQLIFIGWVIIK